MSILNPGCRGYTFNKKKVEYEKDTVKAVTTVEQQQVLNIISQQLEM